MTRNGYFTTIFLLLNYHSYICASVYSQTYIYMFQSIYLGNVGFSSEDPDSQQRKLYQKTSRYKKALLSYDKVIANMDSVHNPNARITTSKMSKQKTE